MNPARTAIEISERAQQWAGTMDGFVGDGDIWLAHDGSSPRIDPAPAFDRVAREIQEDGALAPGATRAQGAGNRARPEEPDPFRTCFERDRDRLLHSSSFRRLAGKTQVFIFPEDHQRTRLTHALEVAQVATAVARACRMNVTLTEAMALGHDCGHGPGGHSSEDALSPYIDGGFEHAQWGADVVLAPLNLCAETLDGIRNHSWSRPSPLTPEGAVVSWADRIAYCCHDLEDAYRAGIVDPSELPGIVVERCGVRRSAQLRAFIAALIRTMSETGQVGMERDMAEALSALRGFNYERVYLRPASVAQEVKVVHMLRALVDRFVEAPSLLPSPFLDLSGGDATRAAVHYVAGMTDRFAAEKCISMLGWDTADLPVGVGGRRH